jgi:hypothetical protein
VSASVNKNARPLVSSTLLFTTTTHDAHPSSMVAMHFTETDGHGLFVAGDDGSVLRSGV